MDAFKEVMDSFRKRILTTLNNVSNGLVRRGIFALVTSTLAPFLLGIWDSLQNRNPTACKNVLKMYPDTSRVLTARLIKATKLLPLDFISNYIIWNM